MKKDLKMKSNFNLEKFTKIENEINEDKRKSPNKKTRRIEIGIYKGGAGKSTTTLHLAFGLARAKRKVLVLDLDPQGNSTAMFGANPLYSLNDWMEGMDFNDVVIRPRPNIHLIGANASLKKTENTMVTMPYGGEEVLEDLLLDIENEYDYVLIDTKPSGGLLNDNAKFYVNELLVPYELKPITLQGFTDYISDFEKIRKKLFKRYGESRLKLKYIVPTFMKETNYARRSAQQLKDFVDIVLLEKNIPEYNEIKILDPIRDRAVVAELPEFGQTIWEYDPKSDVVEDFDNLVKVVLKDE